jgi:hypothetical protein
LYKEKWINTFLPLKAYRWTLLAWAEIQHSIKYIAVDDQNIMKIEDEGQLFNEFGYITNIRENKMSDWSTNLLQLLKDGRKCSNLCKVKAFS